MEDNCFNDDDFFLYRQNIGFNIINDNESEESNNLEKELEDYVKKQKRMDLLNSKINLILPELMSRNTKLIERLKIN